MSPRRFGVRVLAVLALTTLAARAAAAQRFSGWDRLGNRYQLDLQIGPALATDDGATVHPLTGTGTYGVYAVPGDAALVVGRVELAFSTGGLYYADAAQAAAGLAGAVPAITTPGSYVDPTFTGAVHGGSVIAGGWLHLYAGPFAVGDAAADVVTLSPAVSTMLDLTVTATPEPATLLLTGAGLLGLGAAARRRR